MSSGVHLRSPGLVDRSRTLDPGVIYSFSVSRKEDFLRLGVDELFRHKSCKEVCLFVPCGSPPLDILDFWSVPTMGKEGRGVVTSPCLSRVLTFSWRGRGRGSGLSPVHVFLTFYDPF